MSKNERWFRGPTFLYNNNFEISNAVKNEILLNNITNNTNTLISNEVENVNTDMHKSNPKPFINWEYYSSLNKLLRHISWFVKLKNNWLKAKRGEQDREKFTYISTNELRESLTFVIKVSQTETYTDTLSQLLKNNVLNSSNKLLSLSPFINKDSIICVGGRLKHANIPFESKHQIIISKDHPLSSLLITDLHTKNAHVGRDHTLSLLREKYWVPNCRGLIRRILKICLYCKRRSLKPKNLLMSNLPHDRLRSYEKPFTATGIDCFGPLYVKLSKNTRRNQALAKRYGVIFTCLTTRAIHIELSGDLSTDSFILSLRRFIARRGNVKTIRSDNGSNFVGACTELKNAFRNLDNIKIAEQLNIHNIEWKFNPPISPWMGGSWESLIKSIKTALKTITTDRVFTEEVLSTFLCEVESIINSRPLTSVSDDINDFNVLTPNHFVIGSENPNLPPDHFTDDEINYRRKWRSVQAATNIFWKRWTTEYLPTLTKRNKWFTNNKIFEIGDLVLITSNNSPRSHWPMGRVIELYKSDDNIIRTVKLKTPSGTLVRASRTLSLLEHQN